ncbi:hypothetical protein [Polyangium jinanense]|uniref:Secreted protein n=1 Tax=Polyangium jinanense TaxID=2829994 RepID=A0A9X4AWZ1_9BACT|nr:hypothetical protein [Polyangium jinanense]MDC3960800.1 hypothetical protein [Polyangium jinanense]MDC3962307.1 hypothetical protein [Polyangium jinanense]MDC3985822.1 hypothetical protein [Polyangium jinanense]
MKRQAFMRRVLVGMGLVALVASSASADELTYPEEATGEGTSALVAQGQMCRARCCNGHRSDRFWQAPMLCRLWAQGFCKARGSLLTEARFGLVRVWNQYCPVP